MPRPVLDLTDPAAVAGHDFSRYDVVINAAAMTAVDHAESDAGGGDGVTPAQGRSSSEVRADRAGAITLTLTRG